MRNPLWLSCLTVLLLVTRIVFNLNGRQSRLVSCNTCLVCIVYYGILLLWHLWKARSLHCRVYVTIGCRILYNVISNGLLLVYFLLLSIPSLLCTNHFFVINRLSWSLWMTIIDWHVVTLGRGVMMNVIFDCHILVNSLFLRVSRLFWLRVGMVWDCFHNALNLEVWHAHFLVQLWIWDWLSLLIWLQVDGWSHNFLF